MLALDPRSTRNTPSSVITAPQLEATGDDNRISTGACRSCGAYGGSAHAFSCRPGRPRFKLGRFRGVRRSSRLSAAVRARDDVERRMLGCLGV